MAARLEGLTPAEAYDAFFVPAIFEPQVRRLLEIAAPTPGEHMLDLACGTGIVALTFAPALGSAGKILAVDLRPGMLAVATSRPAPAGATIEWRQGDATALEAAAGVFDLVVCQQGLQYFDAPASGAAEMRRVLRTDGRAVVSCWQPLDRQPFFAAMAVVEEKHLRSLALDPTDLYAPFVLGDPDKLHALFEAAGFAQVQMLEERIEARFPADSFVRNVEYAYSAVEPTFMEDPAKFEHFVTAVEADLTELVSRHTRGGEVVFELRTNVVLARP